MERDLHHRELNVPNNEFILPEMERRDMATIKTPQVELPNPTDKDISWRDYIEWLKKAQEHRQSIEKTKEQAEIKIKSELPVGIYMTGDWHLGASGTDYNSFDRDMETVKKNPLLFMVPLSNTIDGYIWPGGIWGEVTHIDEQVKSAKAFAREWNDKLLAVVGSKCHDWTFDKGGISPQQQAFLENIDAGMPFLQNGGLININLNGINYKVGVKHKARYESSLNVFNANRQVQTLQWRDADAIHIAHKHIKGVYQGYMGEGDAKIPVNWGRTGTYKIDDGWGYGEGFAKADLGGIVMVLDHKQKRMRLYSELEEANEALMDMIELAKYKKTYGGD